MRRAKKWMALMLSMALTFNSSLLVLAEEPSPEGTQAVGAQMEESSSEEAPAVGAQMEEVPGVEAQMGESSSEEAEIQKEDEQKEDEQKEKSAEDLESASENMVEVTADVFPDENFRNWISSNVDTDGDNFLSQSEIIATEYMDVNSQGIGNLQGIEIFTSLISLNCSENSLTDLDISGLGQLQSLYCGDNSLSMIDLTANTALTSVTLNPQTVEGHVYSGWNASGIYDEEHSLVEDNFAGQKLNLVQQPFESFAISSAPADFEVGEQMKLYLENQSESPYITEVFKDTDEYSWTLTPVDSDVVSLEPDENLEAEIPFKGCTVNALKAGTVTVNVEVRGYTASLEVKVNEAGSKILIDESHFPDRYFRLYVQTNADGDGDWKLSPSEAAGVTSINIAYYAISNVTGIKYFSNLKEFNSKAIPLSTLDLSGLTKLETVDCRDNSLNNIILSGCSSLKTLDCERNKLTSLDLSDCTELESISCGDNQIKEIDFTTNTKLQTVRAGSQTIDAIRGNSWCLDSERTQPVDDFNQLAGKKIYLRMPKLTKFNITPVNVTLGEGDTGIYYVFAEYDDGSGTSVIPGDTTVQVKDESIAKVEKAEVEGANNEYTITALAEGTTKVTFASGGITKECSLTVQKKSVGVAVTEENFPDAGLRRAISLLIDHNKDGFLSPEEQIDYTTLTVGADCRSLEGIERLPFLITIDIQSPFVKEADLSKNKNMTAVFSSSGALETLNITGLDLSLLRLMNTTKIGNIDLSQYPNMWSLILSGKSITEVDVSKNPKLNTLNLVNTGITSLDLSANAELINLQVISDTSVDMQGGNSGLKSLDLSKNRNLRYLSIISQPIESLDLSMNKSIHWLNLEDTKITEIDVTHLLDLEMICITRSNLKQIDLTGNPNLVGADDTAIRLSNTKDGVTGWYLDEAYSEPWEGDNETAVNNILYRNPAVEEPVYDSPEYTEYDSPEYESPKYESPEYDNSMFENNGFTLSDGFIFGKVSSGVLEEISTTRKITALLKSLGVSGRNPNLKLAFSVYRNESKQNPEPATFTMNSEEINADDMYVVIQRSGFKAEDTWKVIDADNVNVTEDNIEISADRVGTPFAIIKVLEESKDIANADVTGIRNKLYSGKLITQSDLAVTYEGEKLEEGTDYTVTYSANKNPGTAKITIKGSGDYTGTLVKSFRITVAKVSGLETSGETGTIMKLSWTKRDEVTGYEVTYSKSKALTSGVITRNIADNTNELTVAGLTAGKNYYYQVRAFVTVNGKKIYGDKSETYKAVTATVAPGKPAVKSESGQINVSWKAVSGADGYEVLRATSSKGTFTSVETMSGAALSYKDTSVAAGKTYYYKVRTYRTGTEHKVYSAQSAYGYNVTAPKAPEITRVTGGTKKIALTWGKVSGATGYELFMATSKTGTYASIGTFTSSITSYTKTGLAEGRTYYFKLKASRTTSGVTATSGYGEMKYGATRTATPVLNSVTGGAGRATVRWSKVTGASGYKVYASKSANSGFKEVSVLKSGSTVAAVATGLDPATKYFFKIRAYRNGQGVAVYSAYSGVKSCETATAAPRIAKITGGDKQITVRWSNVEKETKYQLYMAESKTGTYEKIATLAADKTSYTKTGLDQGKTYYFKVRTYRTVSGATICSDYSGVKYAATSPEAPMITAVEPGMVDASVRWREVSGASGYNIYIAEKASGTYTLKKKVEGGSKESELVTGLTPGKTYYYRVKAYRAGQGTAITESTFSKVKSAKQHDAPEIAAPVMHDIEYVSGAGEIVTWNVKWEAVSGVLGYEVYCRAEQSGAEWEKIGETTELSLTMQTNIMESSKLYAVRAYIILDGGARLYSPYSEEKEIII